MRDVQLGQPVAGRPGEPVRDLGERAVKRREHWLRVVPVGGVRRRDGVVGHRDGVPLRRVGDRRVLAAVARATTSVAVHRRVEPRVELKGVGTGTRRHELHVHQQGVPARVGEVVRDDAIAAVLGRARHLADHPARVQGGGRGRHVARLEIGEGGTVGDDVLERLDVRVVDGRVVHVAQDAVGDRVPDLRPGVAGGADAVLAGEVEVGEGPGSVRCCSGRRGRCRTHDRRRQADRQGCGGAAPEHPTTQRSHGSPPAPGDPLGAWIRRSGLSRDPGASGGAWPVETTERGQEVRGPAASGRHGPVQPTPAPGASATHQTRPGYRLGMAAPGGTGPIGPFPPHVADDGRGPRRVRPPAQTSAVDDAVGALRRRLPGG